MRIGGETRPGIAVQRRRFELPANAEGWIEVGTGLPWQNWRAGPSAIIFRVLFVPEDSPETTAIPLVSRWVQRPGHESANRWIDLRASLGPVAGKSGSIVLESRSPANATTEIAEGVWTSPAWIRGTRGAQPNLVLISIDTLRADHVGRYGYERDTTPSLDAMTSEGVLFKNASSAASWTLPSHASLLTGLHPSRHGAIRPDTPLLPSLETLADWLARLGYETAGFVGGIYVSATRGFDQGFDRYVDPGFFTLRPHVRFDVQVAQAKEWMSARIDRPFFVFLHTYQVRIPYQPPAFPGEK